MEVNEMHTVYSSVFKINSTYVSPVHKTWPLIVT